MTHTENKRLMNERLWKVADVAEYLQASESWVRHAAAAGNLPSIKVGGMLRFDPHAIRSLISDAPECPVRVRGSVA
jgi:hypothetical protein